jgi:cell division protein FtsQ
MGNLVKNMDEFDYQRPDTRARIESRRRGRPGQAVPVMPGPGRTFATWVANGKIISLPLLLASLLLLIYYTGSPRFMVRDIRVEGVNLLDPAVAIELSAALGKSVWLVDREQVTSNLRTNAYVEQADAFVTMPDRLTLIIRERRPEIHWQSGGQRFLVDADGRVLGSESTTSLTNTLVIEDRSGKPVAANDRLDPTMLDLARDISLRMPNELGQTPSAIAWAPDTGVVIELPGKVIIFGRNNNLDRKISIVSMLLRDGTAFTLLDLRPDTPYYRNDVPSGSPPSDAP